ncbi:hypothetical protein SE91_14295 [Bradyrhizobium sp. DOA1]|nr:hypothetical protein SE91_14295 [Bradyrhizobium sp. DOA1]
MIEIGGAIPGQHFREIRLHRAFALAQLFGPALLRCLAIFGATLLGSTSACERAGAAASSATAAMKINGFK